MPASKRPDEDYWISGVEAFAAGSEGFGTGVFVAAGVGGGGGSSSTDLVGDGSGSVPPFLFEFSFAFALSPGFEPPISVGLSFGLGEAEVFVFSFWLAAGAVEPPAGIPASDSPVGGFTGSTGELFGSATRVESVVVALVGCELRVNA